MGEFERERVLYRQSCEKCVQWQAEIMDSMEQIAEGPTECSEIEARIAQLKVR